MCFSLSPAVVNCLNAIAIPDTGRSAESASGQPPVIRTRLRVKPRPTPANAGQLLRTATRGDPLAVIGQRWLEVERAMGIENTALEMIIH
jgi:hypothetical protein